MDPFDRATYSEPSKFAVPHLPSSPGAVVQMPTPEDEAAAHRERLCEHGRDAAIVLVAFVDMLQACELSHEEAVYLAAHVWRLT